MASEMNEELSKPAPKTLTKLLVSVIASTVFAIFIPIGYNLGVVNAPAVHIKSWFNDTLVLRYNNPLNESDLQLVWAFVVSIHLFAAAISSLGGSWVANKYGRKPGVILSAVLFIISGILYVFCRVADSVELLILGRVVSGFGAGLSTTIGSMYLAEVAPLSLRGSAATCISLGITGGILISQVFSIEEVLGTRDLWEYAISIFVVFVIVSLVPFIWFPESPKYLYILKGEKEKARNALTKLRGGNSSLIEEEMQMMEDEASDKTEIQSIWSVLTNPVLLLPVLLVLLIPFGMQLSGLNAVFFYSVSIFETAGLTAKDAQWATLAVGAMNFGIASFSPVIMGCINRRPLLLLSTFFSIIFLVLFTIIVYFIDYADWLPFASIAAIVFFIVALQVGLGPIAYFIGAELFESGPRPAAMALGSLTSWLGNAIVGMIFPNMQLAWEAFAFLPFAVILLALLLFLYPYMPETRNRNTADVAALISKGLKSKPLQTKLVN